MVVIVALAVLPSIIAAWPKKEQTVEPGAYDYDL